MTTVRPKTIVITTIPGRGVITPFGYPIHSIIKSESDDPSNMESGPRKRKRLTHLSPDQRMMRRKLKNRVAAQTARDRKKMRMDELEEAVTALESENKRLLTENFKLKHKTGQLEIKNCALKERLGEQACNVNCEEVTVDSLGHPESAALKTPLPQEMVPTVYRMTSQYLAFMLLTLSLTSSEFFSKLLKTQKELKVKRLHSPQLVRKSIVKPKSQVVKWWGPQQQSWNPSKN